MDEQEKKYLDDTKEFWAGFPEAPCSDTLKWVDARGYSHMLTLRAYSPHLLLKQIGKTLDGIGEIGGFPADQVKAAPVVQIQEKDGMGTPVVDGDGKPVMVDLAGGGKVYTVRGFYHGVTKSNKDVLKVVVDEKPYSGKFGHICFHPPFSEWKSWPLAGDPPGLFAPPAGSGHVVIQDPVGDAKYPEIIEFKP